MLPTKIKLNDETTFAVTRATNLDGPIVVQEPNIILIDAKLSDAVASLYLIRFMFMVSYNIGKAAKVILSDIPVGDLESLTAGVFQFLAASDLLKSCSPEACGEWVEETKKANSRIHLP